jgi:hypothetical protein
MILPLKTGNLLRLCSSIALAPSLVVRVNSWKFLLVNVHNALYLRRHLVPWLFFSPRLKTKPNPVVATLNR